MNNINSIITEIYNDQEYNLMLSKVSNQKANLLEDLKQEVFLALLTKDEKLIIDLYEKKQLIYYVTKIARIMITSEFSPFYKKYRKSEIKHEIASEDNHIENIEENYQDNCYKYDFDVYEYVKTNKLLGWYDSELFNVYYRFYPSFLEEDITVKVSQQKLADKLGKTKATIFQRLNKIKYQIFKFMLNDERFENKAPLLEFINHYETKHKI